ncbi:hypothetical protein PtrSN002B_011484 [Pyrenophora tritici-repentis]|nr:hypothetical protein PtrSN002B_011484 [Pyrenophora tritici-repentis]
MAGTLWNQFQRAIVIFFDSLLYTHGMIRTLLRRIANNRRTLTAVRSQLAELRKNPALYDSREGTWTAEAKKLSYSERTSLNTE